MWIINVKGTTKIEPFTTEERIALTKTTTSWKYSDNHYEVSIPWKETVPDLPNNRLEAE